MSVVEGIMQVHVEKVDSNIIYKHRILIVSDSKIISSKINDKAKHAGYTCSLLHIKLLFQVIFRFPIMFACFSSQSKLICDPITTHVSTHINQSASRRLTSKL